MKRTINVYAWVVILGLLLAACSPIGLSLNNLSSSSKVGLLQMATEIPVATATVTAPSQSDKTVQSGSEIMAAYQGVLENIYSKVSPSVVNIQVSIKQTTSYSPRGNSQGQSQVQEALGSGFVYDKSGDIVTNNHVVDGADQITVTFPDGSTYPAKVVGKDVNSDLAVIKVDVSPDKLIPVQVGDSTQLKVGQLAIAIGNPFGFEGSMTVGIISALGRSLPVDISQSNSNASTASYTIPDVIQTDAPINPGNSGGVLVNDNGQVIGVTADMVSASQSSSGIGFAIPSEIVQKVVPELIRSGHYDYSWLGITGGTMTPDLAQAMGLQSDQKGVLISDVTSGGPAEKAGLHGGDKTVTLSGQDVKVGGDVIVAVDGTTINKFEDMVSYLIQSTSVGQTIKLTILRQGKTMDVNVVLAARPASSN